MSDLKQSDNSNPLAQITSKICVLSGSTIMLLALALIAAWASGHDKGIGYLGGLNWNDKVHLYFLRAVCGIM